MRTFSSSENYFSISEIEQILACDFVQIVFYPNLSHKTFTISVYLCDVYLGTTRRLKKIPKHSKCPRICIRACCNRVMAENFQ